ncbi:hypothetical protein [Sulfurospirillum halorespirans]|nr:hypothetical protein [Sulfurospirillum halorespirans]
MMTIVKHKEVIHLEAMACYDTLKAILLSDRIIAKCLSAFLHQTPLSIERYVRYSSFKSHSKNLQFIEAANEFLQYLKSMKLNVICLLYVGNSITDILLFETSKKLFEFSINVIAPQMVIASDHEQFWDYVKADITFTDFIVTCKADNVEMALLEEYADGKAIFDSDDLEDIVNYAKYCTLKKRKFQI